MNSTILREYLRERKPEYTTFLQGNGRIFQTSAQTALRHAKIRTVWAEHECVEHDEPEIGSVRLRIEPDDSMNIEDLEGDTFNPKVNSDIPRARLEREQKEFREKVNRDGVWGVIGEYWDGEEWQHADSCFGFVGDQWKDSGYDIHIMSSTLEQASKIKTCPTCHRPLKK